MNADITPLELYQAFPDKEFMLMAKKQVRILRREVREAWEPFADGIEMSPELSETDELESCRTRDFWRKVLRKYINHDPRAVQLNFYERYLLVFKTKISEKTDLTSVKCIPIQDLVPLEKARRRGDRIYACCPIHNERNPSMTIYTKTNTFKCFACGASGDNIAFIMQLKNLTFKDAVQFIGGSNEHR